MNYFTVYFFWWMDRLMENLALVLVRMLLMFMFICSWMLLGSRRH